MSDAGDQRARDALKRSAWAAIDPGETPTPQALWQALGKGRGLVEALLPGLAFLVVYTLTGDVVWSVSAPAVLALLFIGVRAITRSPLMSAVAGLVGILASATVALLSGRAEDNFLLGFIANALWLAGLLVSLALRRPLIGVVYGLLTSDPGWHGRVGVRRVAAVATWMWVGVFSARLAAQVPLYLAGEVATLAVTKLLMGVPLYAAALWITWLLMRAVYRRDLAARQ